MVRAGKVAAEVAISRLAASHLDCDDHAVIAGVGNQVGWGFFGLGLIFVGIFGMMTDLSGLLFRIQEIGVTPGIVLKVEDTSATVNDTPVFVNTYSFRVEKLEAEYRGVAYSTGRQFESGDSVTVEYLASNPSISRIAGTRRNYFDPWLLCFLFLFPLIGLAIIVFGVRNGLKMMQLLAGGRVGLGVLKSKEPTRVRVNNQPIYKLVFDLTTDAGYSQEVEIRSLLTSALEDEGEAKLLYDPHNPARAVLLDRVPGAPVIDELGQVRAWNFTRGLALLILPALSLLILSLILLGLIF